MSSGVPDSSVSNSGTTDSLSVSGDIEVIGTITAGGIKTTGTINAATSDTSPGVFAESQGGVGVHAVAGGATATPTGPGTRTAVFAEGGPGTGVYATSASGDGAAVGASGTNGTAGVKAVSDGGIGVSGKGALYGVYGESSTGTGVVGVSANGIAGQFVGRLVLVMANLEVAGNLHKSGGGFVIDHPLDPKAKYFHHAFVESSERKNVYDGVVTLDSTGRAEVELPAWIEAINRDFRYQLTPLGEPAGDLHVARKISDGRFAIAGGQPGMEVSWQVTGVRKDAWAQANPLEVETEKPPAEQGFYRHPELHGEPEEKRIAWARIPDVMRRTAEEL